MCELFFNIQRNAHLLKTRYSECIAQMEGSNQWSISISNAVPYVSQTAFFIEQPQQRTFTSAVW
jgi:hypothetical protein